MVNQRKSDIDLMIKRFLANSYLIVLDPFTYKGVKMCRSDIFY